MLVLLLNYLYEMNLCFLL